jgi:hypothetical protein
LQDLVRRRVPYILAAYVGGSWGFLQVTDYLVGIFLLSPHWNRVALMLVVLLLPSVLMVAYFHGSPGKDRWQVIEKIGIPVNVAAALIVLFLAFGDTDLGASTASVTVENEDGELVERVVAKPEFRRRTSLFSFDLGEGIDEENAWMSYVASDALWVDLTQDDFIEPLPDRMIQQELWGAGHQTLRGVPLSLKRELATDLHSDHFVTGEIRRAGEGYGLAIQLYDTESGRVVAERAYQGPALLPLVDSASVDIESELDTPERDAVVDLPVAERLSPNHAAVEAYGRGVEAVLVRTGLGGGHRPPHRGGAPRPDVREGSAHARGSAPGNQSRSACRRTHPRGAGERPPTSGATPVRPEVRLLLHDARLRSRHCSHRHVGGAPS